jgi:hypothetical protein
MDWAGAVAATEVGITTVRTTPTAKMTVTAAAIQRATVTTKAKAKATVIASVTVIPTALLTGWGKQQCDDSN